VNHGGRHWQRDESGRPGPTTPARRIKMTFPHQVAVSDMLAPAHSGFGDLPAELKEIQLKFKTNSNTIHKQLMALQRQEFDDLNAGIDISIISDWGKTLFGTEPLQSTPVIKHVSRILPKSWCTTYVARYLIKFCTTKH
jgi:hypothetical protein